MGKGDKKKRKKSLVKERDDAGKKLLALIRATVPKTPKAAPESELDLVRLAASDAPRSARYTDALVAFIDILGFRTIVNRSRDISERYEAELIERIIGALSIPVADFVAEFRSAYDVQDSGNGAPLVEIQTFSDTIILVAPPTVSGLGAVAYCVYRIARQLLRGGFYCRGAVARGEVYSKRDADFAPIIFGPAFIKAYDLERAAAVGSRVILCNRTTELFRELASQVNSRLCDFLRRFIRQERDGPFVIDVLADVRDRGATGRENIAGELLAIKQQLERVLLLYTESPNIYQKLRRVAEELNAAQTAGEYRADLRITLPS